MVYNYDKLLWVMLYSTHFNLSSPQQPVPRADIFRVNVWRLLCPIEFMSRGHQFSQGPFSPVGLPYSHTQTCQLQNLFSWWGNFPLPKPAITKTISKAIFHWGNLALAAEPDNHVNMQKKKNNFFLSMFSIAAIHSSAVYLWPAVRYLLSVCRPSNHVI